MYIAHQLQKIRIFFTYDGFIAILKQMACTFVSVIEIYCIAG